MKKVPDTKEISCPALFDIFETDSVTGIFKAVRLDACV